MSNLPSDSTETSIDTPMSVSQLMMSLIVSAEDSTAQDTMSTRTLSQDSLSALPAEIRNVIFLQNFVLKDKDGNMRVLDLKTLKFYWTRILRFAGAGSTLYHNITPIFLGNHIFSFEQWYQRTTPGQFNSGRQSDMTRITADGNIPFRSRGRCNLPASAVVFTHVTDNGRHAQHIEVMPEHMMAQVRHARIVFPVSTSTTLRDAVKSVGDIPEMTTLLKSWTAHISNLHGLGFRELQSLQIVVEDPGTGYNEPDYYKLIPKLMSQVVHEVETFEVLFRFRSSHHKEYIAPKPKSLIG